ncbi:MAG: hypothetical protein HY905_16635 [Deltaproteobacteria bacterium]|nr:hypothetical protein [Deltaproteobacteria bacterium]
MRKTLPDSSIGAHRDDAAHVAAAAARFHEPTRQVDTPARPIYKREPTIR